MDFVDWQLATLFFLKTLEKMGIKYGRRADNSVNLLGDIQW